MNTKIFKISNKERQNEKILRLRKNRYFPYLKKESVNNFRKNDNNFYVLLEDIQKEKDVFSKEKDFDEKEVNILSFCGKDYLLYKTSFQNSEKEYYETKYIEKKKDNIYKVKEEYIKGYLCVEDKDKKEYLVPIVSEKKSFLLPILLFLILLCVIGFLGCWKNGIFLHSSKPNNDINYAENSIDYNDEPIEVNEDEDESEKNAEGEIKFNLIVNQTVNKDSEIPFANYSTNIDNLRFLVKETGSDEVIFDTKVIKPGKAVNWKVSDYLDSGSYALDIYLIPYTTDGEEGVCTRIQKNVTINVQ